jgi:hypothetical protein
MFVIAMPTSFAVGDTSDCTINRKPARLTWRDRGTLVIEPDDARAIVTWMAEDGHLTFICGGPGEGSNAYAVPDENDCLVVTALETPRRAGR